MTGRGVDQTKLTSTARENWATRIARRPDLDLILNFAYTAAGLLWDIETGSAASCSGGNVTIDDAGRLSGYASYTYLYDAQGRLVSACNDADCAGSSFRRIDFTYDGEGHRTGVTETPVVGSAVETIFRYQGNAIVGVEVDGLPHHEYVTDPAGTIVKVIVLDGDDPGTYLPVWNGHGDAMALYRVDGADLTLANSYTYDTWGQPTTATHNGIGDLGFRFLYVGAAGVQWDGTYGLGLTYMRARHYSPELGRFLQPDPSRQDAQLFVYVGNSPVTTVDPSGEATLMEKIICLLTVGVVGCYDADRLTWWAQSEANSVFKGKTSRDRKGDAYKHCCWSGILTWRFGSRDAKTLTDAHERWGGGEASKIDYHNNAVGREIGKAVRKKTRREINAEIFVARECWDRLTERIVKNGRGPNKAYLWYRT